jgi:Flp pilus assembly protein TadD
LPLLAKAAELAPENARYGYVYAVALQSKGQIGEAITVLDQVLQRRPGDIDTLSALIVYHREAGELKSALEYARRLQALTPNEPSVERLVRDLEAAAE